MSVNELQTNQPVELKHSKLGIASFISCILCIVPGLTNIVTGGAMNKLLASWHNPVFSIIAGVSVIVFGVLAIIFSVIDLTRPNRLKILPLISLIIGIIITALFLLIFVLMVLTPSNSQPGIPPQP